MNFIEWIFPKRLLCARPSALCREESETRKPGLTQGPLSLFSCVVSPCSPPIPPNMAAQAQCAPIPLLGTLGYFRIMLTDVGQSVTMY